MPDIETKNPVSLETGFLKRKATTPDSYRDSHITAVLPKRRDAGGLNYSVRAKFYLIFSKKIKQKKSPSNK
jgi:hypothetical protein